MQWKIFITLLFLLQFSLLPFVYAQETPVITILSPEDGVTYGPWSDTYFDYPRTGGKAHHIRVKLELNEDVAYYRIQRNNMWIEYANDQQQTDAQPEDAVVDFAPDDLEPLDLVGYLSAVQDIRAVAYDEAGNEIGEDHAEFYLAVDLDDYYEILTSEPGFAETFAIRDEDLATADIAREQINVAEDFFSITREVMYITVRNRFTDETEQHTRIVLSIEPLISDAVGQKVSLYTFIPKDIVSSLNDMTLEGDYRVINVDPVMMWNFAASGETTSFSFDVNEKLANDDAGQISTVVVSDVEIEKTRWYFLLPLILPIILLFSIVYFSRFKRRAK